ncbi:MAG: LexA family protein [Gammaproteobacteria bacterium]
MNTDTKKKAKPGRPEGRNAYGEATVPIRIPKSKVTQITDYLKHYALTKSSDTLDFYEHLRQVSAPEVSVELPLYSSNVSAGFPSPCDDHIAKRLNIHDYLVDQEDATFLVTVTGLSMRDAGLLPKDVVVVDRSKNATIGNIILAVVDGEFTIKQLTLGKNGHPVLLPANPDFKAIEIKDGMDFEIWGVVTGSIRKYA